MVTTYGDWTKMKGSKKDLTPELFDEIKELMHEQATEVMKNQGIDINHQEIKWVVLERSNSPFASEAVYDSNGPYISIGWKIEVEHNG
ncbi:hypothetical protein [Paenibacillus sp. Marseille-Q4541]|uniref:hypothetical protein n=1 Tax=Paenibacillus sp. Marseille-Q4541 TaxID=2831522 RepID=UPI001BA6B2B9|nr:hypothetical protein [Paenibacillus sp. Marseille-Q4541]